MRQNAVSRTTGLTLDLLTASLLCLAATETASAQDAAGVGGQVTGLYAGGLSATCANCHGTSGKALAGSPVASLAGLDKKYFIEQMKAFKTGARPATVMHQISKGFSDAQVDSMAAYFAGQRK